MRRELAAEQDAPAERPLKVLLTLKTSSGGQWVVPLAEGLRRKGHDVVVLVPNPGDTLGAMLRSRGILVDRAPAPVPGGSLRRQLIGLKQFRQLIVAIEPDVINYHLYSSAISARLALAGLPLVRVHMVPGPLFLDSLYVRLVERFLCRLDDHIICSTSDLYRRYGTLIGEAGRLSVVPYSVDFEEYRPGTELERSEARRQLRIHQDTFVVVCVSWFYPPKRLVYPGKGLKGHDILLRGWARFLARGGSGVLLLAGSGVGSSGRQYRAELQRLACTLGIEASVQWLGEVDDVRTVYAAADISSAPSRSESYGSVGQASGCGVPTVGAAVGGIPELVLHGVCGWTYPAESVDDLASLLLLGMELKSTGRLRHMGLLARRVAHAVTERGLSVDAYCDTIERLAAEAKPPGGERRHRRMRR